MNATEEKRELCDIRSYLTDDKQQEAILIAIRAIDTCGNDGYDIS